MSKLVDRLHSISHGEVHRMGFGAAQAAAPRVPVLGIIGAIPGLKADLVKMAAQGRCDALLVQINSLDEVADLEEALKLAGDVPFGIELESVLPEDIARLASAGVDFLALHTEVAPSAFLSEEGIGRVATIDPHLEDSLLRTIDRLPIDALLVELDQGNGEFLTVRDLMVCRHIVDMTRKPIILRVGGKLPSTDLASIRDLGIEGIVVDLGGTAAADTLASLRKAIDGLPPRRRPREGREGIDAILPPERGVPMIVEPEEEEL